MNTVKSAIRERGREKESTREREQGRNCMTQRRERKKKETRFHQGWENRVDSVSFLVQDSFMVLFVPPTNSDTIF